MNGSLLLTTEHPDDDFDDLTSLASCLQSLGLIGKRHADDYLCGEQFSQLITFMGCSPHLVLSPPEDGSTGFCHIKLLQFDRPRLFTGQQTAPPRCPACRFRISDWKNRFNLPDSPPIADTVSDEFTDKFHAAWDCPKCHQQSRLTQLDWRQSGGAGKILVEIKNIFPGEAVPVDRLLTALKNLSGFNWKYFYIC